MAPCHQRKLPFATAKAIVMQNKAFQKKKQSYRSDKITSKTITTVWIKLRVKCIFLKAWATGTHGRGCGVFLLILDSFLNASYDTHLCIFYKWCKCSGERSQGQNHSEVWTKYVHRQNAKRKKETSLNVLKKQSLKFNAQPLRIAALSAPRPARRRDARQT